MTAAAEAPASPPKRLARRRKPAARAVRLLIAAGLFALFLYYSHPRAVGAALAGVDWRWVLPAVLLVFVDRALMAWRWIALLAPVARGSRPPLAAVLRIFFVSTFLGTFLPGSIGGDAVRAWSLARVGVSAHESLASVLMDRLLGVIAVFLMCGVGLTLAPEMLDQRYVWLGLALTAGGCAAALLVAFNARIAARYKLFAALNAYRGHRGDLIAVLAASVGVQVIRVFQAWLLGLSLGITAGLAAYFAFIPMILLIMLLPITFNGIGTSQAAFVWAFGYAGVGQPEAFALSVLFVALGIVGNLPGAVLYATGFGRDVAEARA